MIRWFRSLFAWHLVENSGVWLYWENTVTGRRDITRGNSGGHQPRNDEWLSGAPLDMPPPPGPIDIGGGSIATPPRRTS